MNANDYSGKRRLVRSLVLLPVFILLVIALFMFSGKIKGIVAAVVLAIVWGSDFMASFKAFLDER